MLEEIKQKIIQVNIDIEKAKSNQRKRQLLKYKHRLEKDVMTYMYYRYGVILKKDKWGDNVANEQNLIPTNKLTESEQRELARKGGIASGKARRKKADFIKVAKALLDCDVSEKEKEQIRKTFPIEDEEISYRTMIFIKQIEEARKGNINSAKFLVETTGEKADNNVNIETKSPIFNIEVTDNSKLEKKFREYETNTKTD